jgi:hypothetical protein
LYLPVTYSYLILPLAFLLFRSKIKDRIPATLTLYGLVFFGYLMIYYETPKDLRKYVQAFYTLLEYSFFTYIFWFHIRKKAFKNLILIASVSFITFQIFFVTTATFIRLDSIPIGIETILLFIYIFYFFYEFSKYIEDTFIYNHYTFWIAVGIMIYLGGSFFFYILINSLTLSEIEKFGNMTFVAEIIKNLLFAFSIFIYKKYPVNKVQNHSKNIPNLDMI